MDFKAHIVMMDQAVQEHLGGAPVIYQPEAGPAIEVTGMFDDVYRLADQGQAGVEQVVPAVVLRLEDLPVHPREDKPTLTIAGKRYRVRKRETDGLIGGQIRLLLHRADI